MRALAIIPARGGSRGLKRKNLVTLGDRPLLAWTVDAGLAARRVHRVVVTSEDPQILAEARRAGAEALRRPAALATDAARTEPVLRHALAALMDPAEVVVLLQPTSPLRNAADIDEALALFEEPGTDGVISVVEPGKSPFKAFYHDPSGFLRPVAADPEAPFRPRQALPAAFFPNGAIYAVRVAQFISTGSLLPPHTRPFLMPSSRSLDIDSAEDLAEAARRLTYEAAG